MSSEIDRVARTCFVIECNGMGILLMSGYAVEVILLDHWVRGAMQLPPADVAASAGERFAHLGRHEVAVQAAP